MLGTAIATSARILWRMLERRGTDPAPLFKAAGLDPEQFGTPRARFPLQRAYLAWNLAYETVGDASFGLSVVDVWQPADFHALGCAFLASTTLREALDRLVRYHAVVNDMVSYSLVEHGGLAELSCTAQDCAAGESTILEDIRWAVILDACRRICGENLDPVKLAFRHGEPPHPAIEDFRNFFRCPLHFGEPVACMTFSADVLDKQLPASNREVALVQDRVLSEYLGKLQCNSIVSRTKSAIGDGLVSGHLTSEAVARALHMTPRNLQRKLAAEDTTFSKLVEAVRRELAESYLADQSLTLMDISYLLGFSERSSFSRAFKRWTGRTPQEYRERELLRH